MDEPMELCFKAFGLAALIHICLAPSYSKSHHTMYFYFLPFAVISLTVVWLAFKQNVTVPSRKIFFSLFFWGEILFTSFYMLHLRHTRISNYVLHVTSQTRSLYLNPSYLSKAL